MEGVAGRRVLRLGGLGLLVRGARAGAGRPGSRGGGDRGADRGGRGTLGGLARADRRQVRPVEQVYVDLGRLAEAQDRVALPVHAGDPATVEADPLLEGPARRLGRAALDLVAHAVGVDHPSHVDRDGEPADPDRLLGLHLRDDRAVGAPVLVAGQPDPQGSSLGEVGAPACRGGRRLQDGAADGKRLYFTLAEPEADIWVLELRGR